jgi:phosphatidylglycerol---prolipoprotein diacylglyceryl transferase
MRPLIPYLEVSALPLFGESQTAEGGVASLSLQPFGFMVGIGVWAGILLSLRLARKHGLSQDQMVEFLFVILSFGFVGGHLASLLFYYPHLLGAHPLGVFRIWEGQSSLGGFLAAMLGAWLWARWRVTALLPWADLVASALPLGWFFGRLGCALVHDHPGIRSEAWWAVAYPGGGRLDLGLIEAAWALATATLFLWLRRWPRPAGFFSGWLAVGYAPLRFALDFLRARDLPGSDVRYWGLTFAQWSSAIILILGIMGLSRTRVRAPTHG